MTSPGGTDIDSLTIMHGLRQLSTSIDPTHLLPNSLFFTISFFTDKRNLAVDCGVHSFFNPNSHH